MTMKFLNKARVLKCGVAPKLLRREVEIQARWVDLVRPNGVCSQLNKWMCKVQGDRLLVDWWTVTKMSFCSFVNYWFLYYSAFPFLGLAK